MKKTNLILLALLLILGATTFWFLKSKKNTNVSGYDFEFAVKDTASVYKIFLADRSGKQVILTRETSSFISSGVWRVNNRYKARPDVLHNLLETINRVELKYRLPRNAVQNVVKDIATNAIKVEIYDKHNDKLKAYYVGGVNMDESGTHMMMENANEPYVTHIPGFNGGLRVRYFTDEIDWRDRMIFTLQPEEIQSVSIEYPLQKIKSFKLSLRGTKQSGGNTTQVEPLFSMTPRMSTEPVKGLVESFLLGFKFLGAEGFENGYDRLDSLKATVPFAIIQVATIRGDTQTLKLHPIIPHNADGTLILNEQGSTAIDKYYAESNTGDLYQIQHILFQKIFWAYPNFFNLVTRH